jgi:pimeloyl-ACP methyl ester carboxylesterase
MREPERLSTPDGRSLDLYIEGPPDGKTPLVFICGTPGSGIAFQPFVDVLAERGMRYVSWSRPGYGSSTRQPGRDVADFVTDTATVLDHLGADRCHVLGWSGGGPHAMACAALLPDRVEAVATIGGVAPWPAEGLDWMAGMGEENIEEFSASLESPEALIVFKERAWPIWSKVTAQEVADAFGDLIDDVDRGSLTGEFSEWTAAVFREGLREGYWGWFDDDMAFIRPWGFDLASIRVPVHIWQGGHDRMVPFAHGEWLAAHVGNACPHLFAEHGHLSLAVDSLPRILDELIGAPSEVVSHG